MKKVWMIVTALSAVLLMPQIASAQSLKDILKSSAVKDAVTAVTGGKARYVDLR